jgi:hypothetical protein
LLAKALLPLTVVFILSACGGSTTSGGAAVRGVRGDGFTVRIPEGWRVTREARAVIARRGRFLVSVTRFPLLKTYDPARFDAAAKELDGIAAKLAAQAGGSVTERATTTVGGEKIRAYRYTSSASELRIGFFLVDKREYQLFCQQPSGRRDPDDACSLLFDSFTVP